MYVFCKLSATGCIMLMFLPDSNCIGCGSPFLRRILQQCDSLSGTEGLSTRRAATTTTEQSEPGRNNIMN